jgi:hypothetical protein
LNLASPYIRPKTSAYHHTIDDFLLLSHIIIYTSKHSPLILFATCEIPIYQIYTFNLQSAPDRNQDTFTPFIVTIAGRVQGFFHRYTYFRFANMSNPVSLSSPFVLFSMLITLLPSTALASPLPHLHKRSMGTGAKAGLGVGIAVAAALAVGLAIFFVVHFRRSRHLAAINKERAILAGEKNSDGSDKLDKFAPEPQQNPAASGGMPRRQKSVKDRLMGPLYRGSTIDLMPMPKPAYMNKPNRSSTASTNYDPDQPFIPKPFADSSPRPSFSSKRATRMMMMM